MSSPRWTSCRTRSRSTSAAQTLPIAASGTLNQKTHDHPISTSAPPSTGPITSPTAATIVFVPIAEAELLDRERVGHDRARVREDQRAADPLQHAPADQLAAARGEAGRKRREREDDEPGDVRAACGRTGRRAGPRT